MSQTCLSSLPVTPPPATPCPLPPPCPPLRPPSSRISRSGLQRPAKKIICLHDDRVREIDCAIGTLFIAHCFTAHIFSSVVDQWHFGTDLYLCLTDPDADPGGPKHTEPTDPDADPERWWKVTNKSQNSRNQDFLTIFAWWWKDPEPDPFLWLTDPDTNPGGPKTYGS